MSASCSPSSSRVSAGEVDAQRPHALELGQQRPQRVAPVELVGPVGGDEQERLVAERGGQEAQERARGRVGPVQVLDHQQDRRRAREPVEHGQQRLEHARLVAGAARALARLRRARAAASPARRGCRPAARRAPGRASRTSGRSAVTSGAYASSPSPSSTQSPLSTRVPSAAARRLQLAHEPALADAGLADHERERRLAGGGVGQRGLELRQLQRAPDEAGGGDAGRHALQDRRAGGSGQAAMRGRRCSAAWTIRSTSETLSVTNSVSTSKSETLPRSATGVRSQSSRPFQ